MNSLQSRINDEDLEPGLNRQDSGGDIVDGKEDAGDLDADMEADAAEVEDEQRDRKRRKQKRKEYLEIIKNAPQDEEEMEHILSQGNM